jgi:hypothetical protein
MTTPPKAFVEHVEQVVSAAILDSLRADRLFLASETFREQCAHACGVLREKFVPVVPYATIGQLFGVKAPTVSYHWKQFLQNGNVVEEAGRHPLLTPERLTELVAVITESYENRRPMTMSEIKQFIAKKYQFFVRSNTMYHILAAEPRIRSCEALPIDTCRLGVTPQAIQDFERLAVALEGVPAHFVFNMDEMGHQEFADAPNKTAYIPVTAKEKEVYYPVSRNGKRITLIGCIAADGSYIRPAIIIPRKTYDDELVNFGRPRAATGKPQLLRSCSVDYGQLRRTWR